MIAFATEEKNMLPAELATFRGMIEQPPAIPAVPRKLLLIADDLNDMPLNPAGKPHVPTPNFDRLAARVPRILVASGAMGLGVILLGEAFGAGYSVGSLVLRKR